MTDLAVTATQVIPSAGAQKSTGLCGETIAAGQICYLDAATSRYKLTDANDAARNTQDPVVALNSGGSEQPLVVQRGGTVTLGAGASPVVGTVYVASGTPGGICPIADLPSAAKVIVVGVGGATNTLGLCLFNSGSAKP